MLSILGLGHFHPETVIDNAFLEALDIGTNEAWILSRVGIHERRSVLSLDYLRETKNADYRGAPEAATISNPAAGAAAARMAVERAGIALEDVGLVMCGGCSPQWLAPAEASMVAYELGLEAPAFDMHSACSTFGCQLHFAAQMGMALPDYVLCVMVENNTRVIDYRDRSSCVLWGDGCAAAVISTKHAGPLEVVSSVFGGAPSGARDVVIPRLGYFAQEGSKVQKFAIKRMAGLLGDIQASVDAPVTYVGHQANLTMLRSVARRRKVEDRHWFNIDRFGNQGSAGAPIVLSQRWDELAPGQDVGVVVVGAGLSWSRLHVRVASPE
ncbi:MAG: 3-oxoacyl-[acyl-carrier-protein] synthase III C-terminal domain-containing protein [Myxococcota bacterium]